MSWYRVHCWFCAVLQEEVSVTYWPPGPGDWRQYLLEVELLWRTEICWGAATLPVVGSL